MGKEIVLNLENCSFTELQTATKCVPTIKIHNRMLAISYLAEDVPKKVVAKVSNVSIQTLNIWINAFNERGIDGMIDDEIPGRPKIISPEETEVLKKFVNSPKKAGEVHWTAKKFHGFLSKRFEKEISYSTVLRWLHEEDFCLKVPRPWPDKQDESKRKAYKQRIKPLLEDSGTEIWFQDESGFEADPRPRKRWAVKGEKCHLARSCHHIRSSVSGLICPRTGEFYALELPYSDTELFQLFLDEANKDIKFKRRKNIMICDNASWHKSKSLDWGRFEPVYLPPYSPDLNPIERIWKLVKDEWFTDFYTQEYSTLSDQIMKGLKWVIDRKTDNKKTASITENF